MFKYLILFALATVLSLILTPLVRSASRRLGALDLPDERKVHKHPIPRLGGVSIFVAFNLIVLFGPQIEFFFFPRDLLKSIHFLWLLLASFIALGLGAVDDFRRIPPSVKFLFQIIAGLIVAVSGLRIETISLPFGEIQLRFWSIPATVFWVVAITNAINLLDGLDGLAAGTAFIVTLALFGVSLFQQNVGFALVSAILAGSILGFLKYNFNPASIFLGDSGAYFLGFELSVLSLQSSLKGTTAVTILVPIVALGLPIMDTLISMLRRLLNSLHILEINGESGEVRLFFMSGRSMFRADKDHIHHKLLQVGLNQKKAVVLLYGVSLILGALALMSVYAKNINYALLVATIVLASYVGISKLGYGEIQVLRNGVLLPLFDMPVVNRRLLRVFVDMALISFSCYLAFILRFEKAFDSGMKEVFLKTIPLVLITKVAVFYFSGLYRGAWRYTNLDDLLRMVKAVVLGCGISGLLLYILPGYGISSRAVLLIDFNLLLFFVVGARSSFRILEHLSLNENRSGRKVLIYGVGKGGVSALNELANNPRLGLAPVGFIDEDPRNHGKSINGYPVLGMLDSLEAILEKQSISEMILSFDDISLVNLQRLSSICNFHKIPLRRFQTRLESVTPDAPASDFKAESS